MQHEITNYEIANYVVRDNYVIAKGFKEANTSKRF
jgi:hypothetical protein